MCVAHGVGCGAASVSVCGVWCCCGLVDCRPCVVVCSVGARCVVEAEGTLVVVVVSDLRRPTCVRSKRFCVCRQNARV